jgi:microcystin-dependent protein
MARILNTKIQKGEAMLASDMLNLSFCPRGMILMYDGTSWEDNVTLKGWYKCEGQTVVGYGALPDLKNRFVIGYDTANTPQRTKDNNSVSLSSNQIPKHTHGFSGTTSAINLKGNLNIEVNPNTPADGVFSLVDNPVAESATSAILTTNHYTVAFDGSHTHSFSGTTADNASANGAFDNRPSYYALIYIIKVTAAGE